MKTKPTVVVAIAMFLGFGIGFVLRPIVAPASQIEISDQRQATTTSDNTSPSESELLKFESRVTSYTFSEKGIVGIEKVDNENYRITASGPGMCVLSFRTVDGDEVPAHVRPGRFIVSVSNDRKLTVQKTSYGAGGML